MAIASLSPRLDAIDKRSLVREHAQGRTFMDVGGLWGTKNELVTHALDGGARAATMADITPLGHSLWRDFQAHARERGYQTDRYRQVSVDCTSAEFPEKVGEHELVHCSGVIYHVPDPAGFYFQFRRVTGRFLIVSSMAFPRVIKTEIGRLTLPDGGALFIPGLKAKQRDILAAHMSSLGLKPQYALNLEPGAKWDKQGRPAFGPWWWVLTPAVLDRMAEAAGWRIVERGENWRGRGYTQVLELA